MKKDTFLISEKRPIVEHKLNNAIELTASLVQ